MGHPTCHPTCHPTRYPTRSFNRVEALEHSRILCSGRFRAQTGRKALFYRYAKPEVALDDPLVKHGVGNLQEAGDVRTVDQVARRAVGLRRLAAVVVDELDALTDRQERRFLAIVALGEIPVADPNIRAIVAGIFGAVTATRTNILYLKTETVSEATYYGLPYVLPGHIENARM